MVFMKMEARIPMEFKPLIRFMAFYKLSYYMHEAPDIQCELVEEFWSSTEFYEGTNEISFVCKGKSYTLTSALLRETFRLPETKYIALAKEEDIRKILDQTNYDISSARVNLGEVVRKGYRIEWSYFFDSIIKVLSSKVGVRN